MVSPSGVAPEICGRIRSSHVSDALDRLGETCVILEPTIRALRNDHRCFGPVFPMLATPDPKGQGRKSKGLIDAVDAIPPGAVVLIASADRTCALWGETVMIAALARGAAGVVCTGMVRDVGALRESGIGVFSAGVCPRRALDRIDISSFGVAVEIGGARINPGDLIVGDEDGVVTADAKIAERALEVAAGISEKEDEIFSKIRSGSLLRDIFGAA